MALGTKQYRRAAQPAALLLTDRDITLLTALGEVGYLSRSQIEQLYFGGRSQVAYRRLRRLFDNHYIERVPSPGYDAQFVYTLNTLGSGVVSGVNGQRVRVKGRVSRTGDPLKRYPHLLHDLHISDFFVALELAARQQGCQVIGWMAECRLGHCSGDPSPAGEVVPDAFFELLLPDDSSFLYFLENDESQHAHAVWEKRAETYLAYSDPGAGHFRHRFGQGTRDHFRLLVVCPPDFRGRSRCRNLQRTIENTIGPSDLFLLTTRDQLTPVQIFNDIWVTPGGQQRCSLLANPGGPIESTRSTE